MSHRIYHVLDTINSLEEKEEEEEEEEQEGGGGTGMDRKQADKLYGEAWASVILALQ